MSVDSRDFFISNLHSVGVPVSVMTFAVKNENGRLSVGEYFEDTYFTRYQTRTNMAEGQTDRHRKTT